MDIQEEIKRAIENFKGHCVRKEDITFSIKKGRVIFNAKGFVYCESVASISADEEGSGLSREEVIAANIRRILKFIDDAKNPCCNSEEEYECICDTDALQYACIELENNIDIIISAEEVEVFDQYVECAVDNDKAVVFNKPDFDNEPYKLVYGGLMPQCNNDKAFAMEAAKRLVGGYFIDLEEEQVNVSLLEDIKFFEMESSENSFLTPFVALMKTSHNVSRTALRSKTLFPFITGGNFCVADNLLNRPFLLACRYTECLGGLTKENWTEYVSKKRLMEAYNVAGKVFITNEKMIEEE